MQFEQFSTVFWTLETNFGACLVAVKISFAEYFEQLFLKLKTLVMFVIFSYYRQNGFWEFQNICSLNFFPKNTKKASHKKRPPNNYSKSILKLIMKEKLFLDH